MSDAIPGTSRLDRSEFFARAHHDGPPIPSEEENVTLQRTLDALPVGSSVTLCRIAGGLIIGPGGASSLETNLLAEI